MLGPLGEGAGGNVSVACVIARVRTSMPEAPLPKAGARKVAEIGLPLQPARRNLTDKSQVTEDQLPRNGRIKTNRPWPQSLSFRLPVSVRTPTRVARRTFCPLGMARM